MGSLLIFLPKDWLFLMLKHFFQMAPLYEQIRKGLGLELASDAMNDQATMNPDAAVFVPGVGAHRSKSG